MSDISLKELATNTPSIGFVIESLSPVLGLGTHKIPNTAIGAIVYVSNNRSTGWGRVGQRINGVHVTLARISNSGDGNSNNMTILFDGYGSGREVILDIASGGSAQIQGWIHQKI